MINPALTSGCEVVPASPDEVVRRHPVSQDAAEGLYRLVDAAYEKRSVALSSNLHPAAFDELMPKTLATATVDRLLHHAHVCQTTGDSVRLSQALNGQGVSPLS
jgi:DNA replication protein DnaC